MINIFTTRELSIGFWFIIFLLYLLFSKSTRKEMYNLIKIACSKQLFVPFILMITYSLGITYAFYRTPFWKSIFLKDIIIWVIFVGTPLYFGAINKCSENNYFRKVVVDNFKLTVFVEFLVNNFTFPLIIEFILVPVLTLLFLLDFIAGTKSEYRPSKRLLSTLIVIINLVIIFQTVLNITNNIRTLINNDNVISIFIPAVFSILFIPISYMLKVFCKYQNIFWRMYSKESADNVTIKRLHRLKTIWVCNLSLKKLNNFEKSFVGQMYVNMNEEEFDNLMHRFKQENTKLLVNDKYTDEEKKIVNYLNESEFKKKIQYVNNNIGIFTLLFTFIVGLISILLKGFYYVFICGKFDYWGINHSYIDITYENVLYELLLYGAGSILYLALNYIPFAIITSNKKWYKKLFNLLVLLFLTSGALFLFYITIEKNFTYDKTSVVALALACLILTILLYFIGLLLPITSNRNKKNNNGEVILLHKLLSLSTCYIFVISISIYVLLAYLYGKNLAASQKSLKIIDNNYAVIYEDKEYFIISDCVLNKNKTSVKIENISQKQIKKENIKTVRMNFTQIIN